MMGTKIRLFGPLDNVSLEDLVAKDHFYRPVECLLDLSFVRDQVTSCYAPIGRPSTTGTICFTLVEPWSQRQGVFNKQGSYGNQHGKSSRETTDHDANWAWFVSGLEQAQAYDLNGGIL